MATVDDGWFDGDWGDRARGPRAGGPTAPSPNGGLTDYKSVHGTPQQPQEQYNTSYYGQDFGPGSNLFLSGYIPLQNYLYANSGRQLGQAGAEANPGVQNIDASMRGQAQVVQTPVAGVGGTGSSGGGGTGGGGTPTQQPNVNTLPGGEPPETHTPGHQRPANSPDSFSPMRTPNPYNSHLQSYFYGVQ